MEDDWDKLCLLVDMFPDTDFDILVSLLQEYNGNLDSVTDSIVDTGQSPRNAFDHLVATFPEVEVEAIEAFLVANEPIPQDFTQLESIFMVALSKTGKIKERSLKMNLSDFIKVIDDDSPRSESARTSFSYNTQNRFLFSFYFGHKVLLAGDNDEYNRLRFLPFQQVREMAVQAQGERIALLKRAAESYKHGNMTGMGSASYYSSQGRNMTSGVERLHRIAAQLTLESFNPTLVSTRKLDLHHLYVEEAVLVTAEFINYYELCRVRGQLSIVTGRGNHSTSGKSRLTPAIWNMLKNSKKKFSFDGIATFSVFL